MSRSYKHKERVELDIELEGIDSTIRFNRVTEGHRENYGADADGNRGWPTWMVDSDEASDIELDFDNHDLYKSLSNFDTLTQKRVEEAITKYMAEHEVENAEPEEDDSRYDTLEERDDDI